MGDGWTWTSKDLEGSAQLAQEGWEEVKRRLADETYDMLLLDEFTYPMKFGWVDTQEIVEVLKNRPRSEEHTSELQSRQYLVCRLLLEKNKSAQDSHLHAKQDH